MFMDWETQYCPDAILPKMIKGFKQSLTKSSRTFFLFSGKHGQFVVKSYRNAKNLNRQNRQSSFGKKEQFYAYNRSY